jgi:hypothetical protein
MRAGFSLEPRSLPIAESKPLRLNVGTAPDARLHSPPRTPQWRRIESALARLREGVRGQAGSARVHTAAPKRLREIRMHRTVSTSLAHSPSPCSPRWDGLTCSATPPAASDQRIPLRNWPPFEDQQRVQMQSWSRGLVSRVCEGADKAGQAWMQRAKTNKHFAGILLRISWPKPNRYCSMQGTSSTSGQE